MRKAACNGGEGQKSELCGVPAVEAHAANPRTRPCFAPCLYPAVHLQQSPGHPPAKRASAAQPSRSFIMGACCGKQAAGPDAEIYQQAQRSRLPDTEADRAARAQAAAAVSGGRRRRRLACQGGVPVLAPQALSPIEHRGKPPTDLPSSVPTCRRRRGSRRGRAPRRARRRSRASRRWQMSGRRGGSPATTQPRTGSHRK